MVSNVYYTDVHSVTRVDADAKVLHIHTAYDSFVQTNKTWRLHRAPVLYIPEYALATLKIELRGFTFAESNLRVTNVTGMLRVDLSEFSLINKESDAVVDAGCVVFTACVGSTKQNSLLSFELVSPIKAALLLASYT